MFYPTIYTCITQYSANTVYNITFYFLAFLFPNAGIAIAALGITQRQRKQIATTQVGVKTISKKDSTVIFTIMVMTCSFYVMWTPYFIFVNIWEFITGHTFHPTLDIVFTYLGACNSFVNP